MESCCQFAREAQLQITGVQRTGANVRLQLDKLRQRDFKAQQRDPAPHQFVTDLHGLGDDIDGRLVDADVISERLAHLVHTVETLKQGHRHDHLRRLAVMLLQASAHQQVELLIRAAQFDIGPQGDRVVALHQRIEKLVDGDRLLAVEALAEVFALKHARYRVLRGEFDHVGGSHRPEPFAVETNFGLCPIQHLEHLIGVGLRIGLHIRWRQRLPCDVLAGGIADHSGEVTDQENDLVPEILKLPHLVEQHGVPEMQVWCGGVKARFDAQRTPGGEASREILAFDDLFRTARKLREGGISGGHGGYFTKRKRGAWPQKTAHRVNLRLNAGVKKANCFKGLTMVFHCGYLTASFRPELDLVDRPSFHALGTSVRVFRSCGEPRANAWLDCSGHPWRIGATRRAGPCDSRDRPAATSRSACVRTTE